MPSSLFYNHLFYFLAEEQINYVYTVPFHWADILYTHKGDRSLMANSFKCKLNFPLTPCHSYIICLFSEDSSNRSRGYCMCFNWCSYVWVWLAIAASQILFLHYFKMVIRSKNISLLKAMLWFSEKQKTMNYQ